MSIFGFKKAKETDAIQDGELVTVLLLRRTFPPNYLNAISERNKKEQVIAQDMGVTAMNILPAHKEGGVAWDYAIIERYNENTGSYASTLHYDNEGNIQLPDYDIFGTYIQYTPGYIHDNNLGFSSIIKGGTDKTYSHSDNIVIMQHFPCTLPEKDWNTGFTADMITDEQSKIEHPVLWEREKQRLAAWNDILFRWIKHPEKYAMEKLEEMISSRLLLYSEEDNTIRYHSPEPGMVFNARIARRSRYMDILAFEWDKEACQYNYYSKGISKINADTKALAKSLVELMDILKTSSNEEEEVPF